ncbi:hypothetical protein N2152v2_003653 [Parachlorella kessleri]
MSGLGAVLVVGFTLVAAVCGQATNGTSSTPQVTLVGRTVPGPSGSDNVGTLPQLFTWPASSATVAFTKTASVTVVINGSAAALPATEVSGLIEQQNPAFPAAVFQFDLDGITLGKGNVSTNDTVLTWTHSGLSEGAHNLTITKITEPLLGAAVLESISIDAGQFLAPPPSPGMQSGRRMLFIGDSYTAFGNTGDKSCPGVIQVENALVGFGPTVARHYNADYQLIAWSGAGVEVYPLLTAGSRFPTAYEEGASPLDPALFYRQDALDPTTNYTTQSFVPQIIVLAGGTNDFHNVTITADNHVVAGAVGTPPVAEYVDRYLDFVQQIRALYPQAAIINLVWPLEVQMVGVLTPAQTTIYLQYMAAAYSRLQMAGIRDLYMLQLTGEEYENTNWCVAHPNAATDAIVAGQLMQFIDAVLPSFGGTTGPVSQMAG